MSKAYKVTSRMIQIGERKGETVYSVRPVSYGILSADDVARQIAMESSSTPGDVKAVLDRDAEFERRLRFRRARRAGRRHRDFARREHQHKVRTRDF